MKIKTISLEDFRNHSQSQAELGKINFFLGHNNAGKSSILAAIEWCITGRCHWTDRAGRGALDLIRHGEKTARVTLELEGAGPVVRTMGPAGVPTALLAAGEAGGQAQSKLYGLLGTDDEALAAALNTGSFIAMSPGEQRNFLFSIFGMRWDIDSVTKALQRWATEAKYSTEAATELATGISHLYPPRITAGPEVLDAIEKKIKDQRRETKKDLQRLTAAMEEMIIHYPDGLTCSDLPEMQGQLKKLQSQRDLLLARLADKKQSAQRRRTLEEQLANNESRLKQCREALAALGPGQQELPPQPDPVPVKDLAVKIQELKSRRSAGESLLITVRQAIGALSNNDGRCPLAPNIVKCTMSTGDKGKIIEDLKSQAASLAEQQNRYAAELESLQQEQTTQTKQYNQAIEDLEQMQRHSKTRAALETQLKELSVQAEGFREELQEFAGLEAPDLSPLEEMDERLARGTGLIGALKEAAVREQEMAKLAEDIKSLQKELSNLEILVLAFGPEGIKKQVLADLLGPFEERVNQRLNRLTDGCYQMSWGPDMNIKIYANGIPLPLRLLSSSEQLRIGIALQEAFAHYLGLCILAIDGADMLDQENRDLLTGCLLDIMEAGEYQQALVFSTIGDVDPQSPGILGMKMFWVEDGKIAEI